jgi:hydrogenase nickel incorporation protein HypA/HybF
MHEWALAEAVIAAAQQITEKEKLKEIKEVTVKVGELQQIEKEILLFAVSQLKPPIFRDTKFHLIKAKATLKCRACGTTWVFNKKKLSVDAAEAIHFVPEVAHTYIKCPKCGSPDFEIIKGRGIWLENIKGLR